ncbi:MAG: helix-turn-helix domain-containing protein [Pirellula sp.]|nr:helix-turn-helix domain-containing protein [Pirellula sp.]
MPTTAKKTSMAKTCVTRTTTNSDRPLEPLAFSVADSATLLGIGKRKVWELIEAKQIAVFRAGRRKMVSREELMNFIARGGSQG